MLSRPALLALFCVKAVFPKCGTVRQTYAETAGTIYIYPGFEALHMHMKRNILLQHERKIYYTHSGRRISDISHTNPILLNIAGNVRIIEIIIQIKRFNIVRTFSDLRMLASKNEHNNTFVSFCLCLPVCCVLACFWCYTGSTRRQTQPTSQPLWFGGGGY